MQFTETYYPDLREAVYHGTHKSGLRVFVLPKAGFTKSYVVLATAFGSVNNHFTVDGKEHRVPDGIAHFLEHKMFDQEDGIPVFDRFAALGANANAFTDFTVTAYLYSATAHLYDNLDILLDYTMHPYYTEETVSKEQGIIGQEIRMYEDDPGWNVYFGALSSLYHNHPSNIDIAGTVESIAQITPEALYTCYRAFYHPSNMVLVAVGAVEPSSLADRLDKDIPSYPLRAKVESLFPKEPSSVVLPRVEKAYDIGMPQFVTAFKCSDFSDDAALILKREALWSVVCELLCGKSHTLFNTLYDKGLINDSFSASYENLVTCSHLLISGESADPDAVHAAILDEVKRLCASGVDPAALERAKRACYGRAVSLLDSQESFANAYARFALLHADFLGYPKQISSLTIEEVGRALNELCEAPSALSVIVPKNAKEV